MKFCQSHVPQELCIHQNVRQVRSRDRQLLAFVRADSDQRRLEALGKKVVEVVDGRVEAQVNAEVDDVLRFVQTSLDREAVGMRRDPSESLTEDQIQRLVGLRHEVGSFVRLIAVDPSGTTLWDSAAEAASDEQEWLVQTARRVASS
ncbi:MAG: hypothetical protein AABZ58_10680, partial [Chloroflexota bacterium]